MPDNSLDDQLKQARHAAEVREERRLSQETGLSKTQLRQLFRQQQQAEDNLQRVHRKNHVEAQPPLPQAKGVEVKVVQDDKKVETVTKPTEVSPFRPRGSAAFLTTTNGVADSVTVVTI